MPLLFTEVSVQAENDPSSSEPGPDPVPEISTHSSLVLRSDPAQWTSLMIGLAYARPLSRNAAVQAIRGKRAKDIEKQHGATDGGGKTPDEKSVL